MLTRQFIVEVSPISAGKKTNFLHRTLWMRVWLCEGVAMGDTFVLYNPPLGQDFLPLTLDLCLYLLNIQ